MVNGWNSAMMEIEMHAYLSALAQTMTTSLIAAATAARKGMPTPQQQQPGDRMPSTKRAV